ncbi:MAG TPA: hypothetical protein VMS38_23305 [Pseudorhodoferax sp.]|nr:hypothetical protein [Pseudorhodoferax sp.]
MRFLVLTLALLLAGAASAHEGHDDAAPAAGGPALPRFAASTELFELVGVLDGHHLRVWLDHAPSNAPVENAELALELNGQPLALKPVGAGEFEAELAAAPAAGLHPVTAMVTARVGAGTETDLLAGELDIHAPAAAAAGHTHGWRAWAPWAGAAVAGLALLFVLARRAARRPAARGAAA